MTEIADRYRRNAAAFTERVEAVTADRWSSPSPCEGWTAADIVRHVVESSTSVLEQAGEPVADLPDVGEDPVAAWAAARDAMVAAVSDPEIAARSYTGMFGPSVFSDTVDRFMSTDLTIHTWDLARAVGGDERLDDDEVAEATARVRAIEAAIGEGMRGPGAFGPAIDIGPDASPQDQLLAFVGRDPR